MGKLEDYADRYNYIEDFSEIKNITIRDVFAEYDNNRILETDEVKTDYQQWKEWLDKWNVDYKEKTWIPNQKDLVVFGRYSVAAIVFDLDDNFVRMTAYE